MEAERQLSTIPKKEKSWASQKDLRSKPEKLRRGSKEREESSGSPYMLDLLGQDEIIKSRIEQRTSLTTGTEVMAWKDALSVPQRGS